MFDQKNEISSLRKFGPSIEHLTQGTPQYHVNSPRCQGSAGDEEEGEENESDNIEPGR